MGFQMQRQPVVFLRVFQLGLRDLGVGILPLLLRSTAPLSRIRRSFSSYLLLLWKTKMRKDTNLQKKVYYNIQHFHFSRYSKTQFRRSTSEPETGLVFVHRESMLSHSDQFLLTRNVFTVEHDSHRR